MMALNDDKLQCCVSFIQEHLNSHLRNVHGQASVPSFFVGLNGIQGAGKTTLVSHPTFTTVYKLTSTKVSQLAIELQSASPLFHVVVCSIDDFYLTRRDQLVLGLSNQHNRLLQHRGTPGTHDMTLLKQTVENLRDGRKTAIPRYDKSLFNGKGDRRDKEEWKSVSQLRETDNESAINVIIFEGWSIGFRGLSSTEIHQQWENSFANQENSVLWRHRLEDLLVMNEKQLEYDILTEVFDVFIHIDAEDTRFVYGWREEQEAALRKLAGMGMTSEEVVKFVDNYYPAYELYTPHLRNNGVSTSEKKIPHVRLILGKDRRVLKMLRN